MYRDAVLVLGGYPQTLAVVRSLGAAGYQVVLGHQGDSPIAARSRYCDSTWVYSTLWQNDQFNGELKRLLRDRPEIRYIFPVAERTMQLMMATDTTDIEPEIVMVAPGLVNDCRDKIQANSLATAAELNVPDTRLADSSGSLALACDAIGYPVIVKPLNSSKRVLGRKACILGGPEALAELFPTWPAEHSSLLVQQYVTGTLKGADFVASAGAITGYCEAHSVRTDMPDGTGFGVEFETIPPSPDVLDATRRFASVHNYNGPGLIQFIQSDVDGRLYFLENNPRLSAGVADSIACGVDMPLLSVGAFSSEPSRAFDPAQDPYEEYHRAYWLQRDLEGFIKQSANLSVAQQRQWLWAMLQSFVRADSHINWQWSDPAPALASYFALFRRLARHVLRRSEKPPRQSTATSLNEKPSDT